MKTRKAWRVGFAVAAVWLFVGCKGAGEAASTAPAPSAAGVAPAEASANAAPSATVPAPEVAGKTFDCGAKGQKPCPMQGWMKRVMAPASADEDAEKLAQALTYVAEHPPPGFGEWAAIAGAGAGKAKASDVDGAKASCKPCHDKYKEVYKVTMRDRPF